MDTRWDYIAKPLWRWLVAIPIAGVAAYDAIKSQLAPELPPLWGILSRLSWFEWLLILMAVIFLIIIEGLWRYNKTRKNDNEDSQIIMQKGKRHTALQAGRDINITYPTDTGQNSIQNISANHIDSVIQNIYQNVPSQTSQEQVQSVKILYQKYEENNIDNKRGLERLAGGKLVGLTIINGEDNEITYCEAYIEQLVKANPFERPLLESIISSANLRWFREESKAITISAKNGKAILGIARTINNEVEFAFTLFDNDRYTILGRYIFVIRIIGKINGSYFNPVLIPAIVTYEGYDNIRDFSVMKQISGDKSGDLSLDLLEQTNE